MSPLQFTYNAKFQPPSFKTVHLYRQIRYAMNRCEIFQMCRNNRKKHLCNSVLKNFYFTQCLELLASRTIKVVLLNRLVYCCTTSELSSSAPSKVCNHDNLATCRQACSAQNGSSMCVSQLLLVFSQFPTARQVTVFRFEFEKFC